MGTSPEHPIEIPMATTPHSPRLEDRNTCSWKPSPAIAERVFTLPAKIFQNPWRDFAAENALDR
jgi:hypothetical protein